MIEPHFPHVIPPDIDIEEVIHRKTQLACRKSGVYHIRISTSIPATITPLFLEKYPSLGLQRNRRAGLKVALLKVMG